MSPFQLIHSSPNSIKRSPPPVVMVVLCFAVGLTSAHYLALPLLPLLVVFIGVIALLGVRVLLLGDRYPALWWYLAFVLLGATYLSAVSYPASSNIVHVVPEDVEVEITGVVVSHPRVRRGTSTTSEWITFVLAAEQVTWGPHPNDLHLPAENAQSCEVTGKIWVRSFHPLKHYRYGDRVQFRTVLHRIPPDSAEGWEQYLTHQGIWAHAPTGIVTVLERDQGSWMLGRIYRVKDWMTHVIDRTLPQDAAAVLQALMFGDQDRLPPETLEAFRRTGTGHVLVVSGLHAGLILGLTLFALRCVSLGRRTSLVLGVGFLWVYALLTGLRVPVLRAATMASLGAAAYVLGRRTPPVVILAVAAFILLALWPLHMYTASFQLSFAAVLGIVYLTPLLEVPLRPLHVWVRRSLAVSLAAQIAVVPLLAYYFRQAPFIGVGANLVVVPLITVSLALGFLTTGLALVSLPVAQIVANTNWLCLTGMLTAVRFLACGHSPQMATFLCPRIPPFAGWILLPYYGALVAVVVWARRHLGIRGWVAARAIPASRGRTVDGMKPPD